MDLFAAPDQRESNFRMYRWNRSRQHSNDIRDGDKWKRAPVICRTGGEIPLAVFCKYRSKDRPAAVVSRRQFEPPRAECEGFTFVDR